VTYELGDYLIRLGSAVIGPQSKGHVLEVFPQQSLSYNGAVLTWIHAQVEYKPCSYDVPSDDATGTGAGVVAVVTALCDPVAQSVCPNAVAVLSSQGQLKGFELPSGHDRAVSFVFPSLKFTDTSFHPPHLLSQCYR